MIHEWHCLHQFVIPSLPTHLHYQHHLIILSVWVSVVVLLDCCNCSMSLGNGGIYTVSCSYLHRQKSMGVWSGDLGRHCSKVGSLSAAQPICQCRRHSETVRFADESVAEPHSAVKWSYSCLSPAGVAAAQHMKSGYVYRGMISKKEQTLHILHGYWTEC